MSKPNDGPEREKPTEKHEINLELESDLLMKRFGRAFSEFEVALDCLYEALKAFDEVLSRLESDGMLPTIEEKKHEKT
jgi:hypothetical protein